MVVGRSVLYLHRYECTGDDRVIGREMKSRKFVRWKALLVEMGCALFVRYELLFRVLVHSGWAIRVGKSAI